MNQPIILTNGQHEIKIYTVQNRGRAVFQLSYYEGGKRERKTFAKVSDARREAKLVLGRLALNVHDVAELSSADMESYLPSDRPTAFDGMALYKVPPTRVGIYTPEQLLLLPRNQGVRRDDRQRLLLHLSRLCRRL